MPLLLFLSYIVNCCVCVCVWNHEGVLSSKKHGIMPFRVLTLISIINNNNNKYVYILVCIFLFALASQLYVFKDSFLWICVIVVNFLRYVYELYDLPQCISSSQNGHLFFFSSVLLVLQIYSYLCLQVQVFLYNSEF